MNTNSCKVDLTRLDGMNHQAIKCLAEELQDDAFNLLKQHHPHVKEDHFRKAFHSNIVSSSFVSFQIVTLITEISGVKHSCCASGDDGQNTRLSASIFLRIGLQPSSFKCMSAAFIRSATISSDVR